MQILREYSSITGGRVVETAEGRKAASPRDLGCPQEILDRIETRNAALTGKPATATEPPVDAELETLRGQLAAQAQIPASL